MEFHWSFIGFLFDFYPSSIQCSIDFHLTFIQLRINEVYHRFLNIFIQTYPVFFNLKLCLFHDGYTF